MRYLDLKNAHQLLFSAQSRWFSFDISLNPNRSLDRRNATHYHQGSHWRKTFCPQQKKLFQATEPETVSHLSILLSAASQLLG